MLWLFSSPFTPFRIKDTPAYQTQAEAKSLCTLCVDCRYCIGWVAALDHRCKYRVGLGSESHQVTRESREVTPESQKVTAKSQQLAVSTESKGERVTTAQLLHPQPSPRYLAFFQTGELDCAPDGAFDILGHFSTGPVLRS